ncbi:hypothetical protein [Neptuniibacter marinus]|uniref:hypothetical protein n=1 Tax=Neptuniibacter marinus TaxID=1806670 RepID=UPI00083711A7|nr:hypothetical protein [Neptuniibacter marinus]
MIIPVLQQLNTRDEWMAFCRRETPYCFIETPECLLDFQSSFLIITLLSNTTLDHDAIKYSLGSRTSMEPVWRLIKGCNWSLNTIILGLEEMDFSSNVRDNSLLKVHTDLSVRKYFSRERGIIPPTRLGLLEPLMALPDIWDPMTLNQLISNQQFSDLKNEQKPLSNLSPLAINELKLILLDPAERCVGKMHAGRLHIFRGKRPFISLIPQLHWPSPRLKRKTN